MPATYDYTASAQAGRAIAHGGSPEFRRQTIDISALTTHAASDLIKVIKVNAGEFVLGVWVRTLTASATGSSTFTVGDSSAAAGWVTSVDATAAANTTVAANGTLLFTQATSANYTVTWTGGKGYTAADYVSMTLGGTPPATGIYEIIVAVLPATPIASLL